ncbi:hypothetical protein [Ectobacillus ponti]|uniref:LPXTG cell wall anchor domain-containing protein n=1 Tax=Ectobacillus ponti TaxID=2961894 RepID=A0AA41X2P8_9BACI|nr:hypothetical protein [Ectobacillus ponti]MCP8967821.1 hypothetical protein [Ectobacillus ponti]
MKKLFLLFTILLLWLQVPHPQAAAAPKAKVPLLHQSQPAGAADLSLPRQNPPGTDSNNLLQSIIPKLHSLSTSTIILIASLAVLGFTANIAFLLWRSRRSTKRE